MDISNQSQPIPSTKSIIADTIYVINRSRLSVILEMAEKLKEITMQQYTWLPRENQKIEHLQLNDVICCEGKIAANISAFMGAASKQPEEVLLEKELQNAVFYAAKYSLDHQLTRHEIVSIACALDHVDFTRSNPDDEIFNKIIQGLQMMSSSKSAKDVESDVWANFALRKVKVEKKQLLTRLCDNIIGNKKKLTPLQISLMVTSIVQANLSRPISMALLRKEAIEKKDLFTINQIVNTLWGYCYLQRNEDPVIVFQQNKPMIEAFAPKLIHEIDELNVDQAVRLAWTYRQMNITDQAFFKAIAEKIKTDMYHLTEAALVTIAKSLTSIDILNDCVLIELLQYFQKKSTISDCFTTAHLAEISYAVLVKYCGNDCNFAFYEQFIYAMLQRMRAISASKWEHDHLWQLRTIYIIFRAKSELKHPDLISGIEDLIQSIKIASPLPESSKLHMDVLSHTQFLLKDHLPACMIKKEFPLEGNFSIDIAIPKYKLAIEVDGRCHFDEHGNYIAKNIIKETVLKINGWRLFRITHKQWSLNSPAEVKQEVLRGIFSNFDWFQENHEPYKPWKSDRENWRSKDTAELQVQKPSDKPQNKTDQENWRSRGEQQVRAPYVYMPWKKEQNQVEQRK